MKAVDPAVAAQQAQDEKDEQEKKGMQIQARDLRESCVREETDFHQFLMEREKINYFWIVEKKTLTEKQADLRNKEREYQDLEERQQIELKMFQQRQEYDRKARDMQQKYELRMRGIRDEMEKTRRK